MFYKERDATREKQLIRRAEICQDLLCEILDKKGFKFEVAA